MNRIRSKKGFTLIELMTVIAIVAILLGIAAYSFRETRLRSAIREGTRSLEGFLIQARAAARTRQETVRVNLTVGEETPYIMSLDRDGRQLLTGNISRGVRIISATPSANFTFNGAGMTDSTTEIQITLDRYDSASTGIYDQYRIRISTTGIIQVDRSPNSGTSWGKAW